MNPLNPNNPNNPQNPLNPLNPNNPQQPIPVPIPVGVPQPQQGLGQRNLFTSNTFYASTPPYTPAEQAQAYATAINLLNTLASFGPPRGTPEISPTARSATSNGPSSGSRAMPLNTGRTGSINVPMMDLSKD